jgi:hypothetical protein
MDGVSTPQTVPWVFGILFPLGPLLIAFSPLRTLRVRGVLFLAVAFLSAAGWFVTMVRVLLFHCPRCVLHVLCGERSVGVYASSAAMESAAAAGSGASRKGRPITR